MSIGRLQLKKATGFVWLIVSFLVAVGLIYSYSHPEEIRTMLAGNVRKNISDRKVLAFYYGWYGGKDEKWLHWGSADPLGKTTLFEPKLGYYSSTDEKVIKQQIQWAKQAGIDGFILSWWQSYNNPNHHSEVLEKLFRIAKQENFQVSVYIEDKTPDLEDQITDIIRKGYCDGKTWYTKDSKPVFYVYGRVALELTSKEKVKLEKDPWFQIKQKVKDRTGLDIYLNVDTPKNPKQGAIDAVHNYVITDADVRQSDLFRKTIASVAGYKGGYSVTVGPGQKMADKSYSIPGTGLSRYKTQWQSALDIKKMKGYPGYDPDEILITSWNEWHESSSIEPTSGRDGSWDLEYVNATLPFAQKFRREIVSGSLSPNNTAISSTKQVYFKWDPVEGAKSYALRVKNLTDPQAKYLGNNCKDDSQTYVCIDGLDQPKITLPIDSGSSYAWWVHVIYENGSWSNPATATFTMGNPGQNEAGCSDSDGGKNHDQVGLVQYKNTGYLDKCQEKTNFLEEYYCENGEMKQEIYQCTLGCSGGKCN